MTHDHYDDDDEEGTEEDENVTLTARGRYYDDEEDLEDDDVEDEDLLDADEDEEDDITNQEHSSRRSGGGERRGCAERKRDGDYYRRGGRGGGRTKNRHSTSSSAVELCEALQDKIRALNATVDTLLEKNAELRGVVPSRRGGSSGGRRRTNTGLGGGAVAVGRKRSSQQESDDDEDEDDEEQESDEDDAIHHRYSKKRRYDKAKTSPQRRLHSKGEPNTLREPNGHLRNEGADKDATIREQKDRLKLRSAEISRISLENDRLKTELDAVKDGSRRLRDKYRAVCAERDRLRDNRTGSTAPQRAGTNPSPRGVGRPKVREGGGRHVLGLSKDRGSEDRSSEEAIAHLPAPPPEYLTEPVTKALDAVMKRGVNALFKFQKGKPHHRKASGERVYYVCQACSSCRENPTRARYTSFKTIQYPDHPLRYPGFASYDAPLPHQARIDLRRHLREQRSTPGIIVADPPAAQAPIRPRQN